jgi:hypothetical protein
MRASEVGHRFIGDAAVVVVDVFIVCCFHLRP